MFRAPSENESKVDIRMILNHHLAWQPFSASITNCFGFHQQYLICFHHPVPDFKRRNDILSLTRETNGILANEMMMQSDDIIHNTGCDWFL